MMKIEATGHRWRFQDLTGQRFGRLVVLGLIEQNKNGKAVWLCRCDCGREKAVVGAQLKQGISRSCGCLRREMIGAQRRTHARSRSPEYAVWCGMKSRCGRPRDWAWGDYGGRGIGVCKRWAESFPAFLADVGPRPSPDHVIDRIDVNGNYEPGNVRWATTGQSACNRRDNRWLTHDGVTLTMSQWVERTGLTRATIRGRIDRRGWDVARALTTPPRAGGPPALIVQSDDGVVRSAVRLPADEAGVLAVVNTLRGK